MATRIPNLDWWLRLPLVPVVFAVGCAVVLVLVVIQLAAAPWYLLYPEYHRHAYDYGDERQQRIVDRWRMYCRRVPLRRRLIRLFSELRTAIWSRE